MAGMQLQGCQCNRGGTSTEPHGGGQNIEHLYRTTSICMHSDNFHYHIFGDHHSLGLWCILLWPLLQFVVFKVVKCSHSTCKELFYCKRQQLVK